MRPWIALAAVLAASLILPSGAAGFDRTWLVDTTFTAGAPADTVVFRPWAELGRYAPSSWTAKLSAADDTSTVRLDWYCLGCDTVGHQSLSLIAGTPKGASGRLDSCIVYLPENHQTVRFELWTAESPVPPTLGQERIDRVDRIEDLSKLDEAGIDTAMVYLAVAFSRIDSAFGVRDDTTKAHVDTAADTIKTAVRELGPIIEAARDSIDTHVDAATDTLKTAVRELPAHIAAAGDTTAVAAREVAAAVEASYLSTVNAQAVHQICPGDAPIGHRWTLTSGDTSAVDSLVAITPNWHYPIWKITLRTDQDIWFNWSFSSSGDTNAVVMELFAGDGITLEATDIYRIWYRRRTADASISSWLWPDTQEAVAP